jgi:hypothetical protein
MLPQIVVAVNCSKKQKASNVMDDTVTNQFKVLMLNNKTT